RIEVQTANTLSSGVSRLTSMADTLSGHLLCLSSAVPLSTLSGASEASDEGVDVPPSSGIFGGTNPYFCIQPVEGDGDIAHAANAYQESGATVYRRLLIASFCRAPISVFDGEDAEITGLDF
ncbi:hypothetical protein KIPB_014853, partial [Kipferlia bialata]